MIIKLIKSPTHGQTAVCKCDECGKIFKRRASHARRRGKHLCSMDCRGLLQSKQKSGKKFPKAWCENIRKSKMGSKNPMYGKEISEKHRSKLRESSKRHWQDKNYRRKLTKKMRKLGLARMGKGKKTRKNMRQRADQMWRRVITKKAKGCCEVCNKSGKIDSHHMISRRNLHLRFDVRNGIALCPSHHVFGKESAHSNPIWFIDWLKDNRLADLEYLRKEQYVLEPNFDYEKAIKRLKKLLLNDGN